MLLPIVTCISVSGSIAVNQCFAHPYNGFCARQSNAVVYGRCVGTRSTRSTGGGGRRCHGLCNITYKLSSRYIFKQTLIGNINDPTRCSLCNCFRCIRHNDQQHMRCVGKSNNVYICFQSQPIPQTLPHNCDCQRF